MSNADFLPQAAELGKNTSLPSALAPYSVSKISANMINRFILLLFLLLPACMLAQDLHFSQPYHNPMHFNPAQTGAFTGTLRAMGMYRDQWSSVPVSFRTFALGADMKAWERESTIVGAGLLIQQDKAGDAGLSWTQIGLSGSVIRMLNDWNALAAGFGVGFMQRRFDISGLTFRNQWTGDVFDPALPTKENFNQSSGLKPSISAGLSWIFANPDTRTRANLGAGIFHLNQPYVGFQDDAGEKLPSRIAIQANTTIQLNEFLDLVVFGVGQRMKTAQEVLAGGGGRIWLVPEETALQFTLGMRLGDALIPAIQYEFGNWTVGVSYDWNISDFDVATRGRGGFELAVVYRAVPVPPVKAFKSCPIF
ncbi:MAG: type IX secretion system membrane protein PorP/SprF [Bacteroidetes bacterium]|nr:MAG: type IX secretion system membrane protein PorP/SprF [Bacteroidota bacterium]